MIVTSIDKIDKKKSKITIDECIVIPLYISEIRKYNIEINKTIEDDDFSKIYNEILPARCKERAFYILKDSDKTEYILRQKLSRSFYPNEIIDNVILTLQEYGYIDDVRYTSNYIRYNINIKSINKIKYDLMTKGVSKEIVCNCIDDLIESGEYSYCEEDKIRYIFEKKKYDFSNPDEKKLNKIIASSIRKGYKYNDISRVIKQLEQNI